MIASNVLPQTEMSGKGSWLNYQGNDQGWDIISEKMFQGQNTMK